MDKTGWTPGPWRITSDAGHPVNARITSTSRRHIAKVYAEWAERDETCEANAHLIAAAPELAEALENLLTFVEVGPCESEVRISMDVADAKTILAKARGKKP